MGKKGKKKAKVTGTPDVVKFKTTSPYYPALLTIVAEYESLPEVRKDMLSAVDYRKLYKFFTMLGALGEFTKSEGKKEYRFMLHHMYLAPTPQYNPVGYRVDLIERSRKVVDMPALKLNGKAYPWTKWQHLNLITEAESFLEQVDKLSMSIPSYVQDAFPDFAAMGLKKFKMDLQERMWKLDDTWRKHEELMMKVWLEVHDDVFAPVVQMVSLEQELSKTEEGEDMVEKQKLEEDLVKAIETFYNLVYPPKPKQKPEPWGDDVIPLAEACVFYETKFSDEHLNLCRHVIKTYLELRKCIAEIPTERMNPEYLKNENLCRVLGCFQRAVFDARQPIEMTAGLPLIKNFKKEQWMTRCLLEPEVEDINSKGCKIADVMLPPAEDEEPDDIAPTLSRTKTQKSEN